MLENIRKYSALMIIVLALLAFGLIVTLGNGNSTSSKSDVVTVNGEGYSEKVLNTQFDILEQLSGQIYNANNGTPTPGNQALVNYTTLISYSTDFKENNPRYMPLINQLLINQEAERLGIFVKTQDAEEYITENIFNNGEGKRNFSVYNKFVEKSLDRMGMKEADFKKVIVNLLTTMKVYQIKSQLNLPASLALVDIETQSDFMASIQGPLRGNMQTIDASIVQFDIKDYLDKATPTEDDLKTFFEKNKNQEPFATAFRSPKQIKLTYIPVNLKSVEPVKPKADEKITEADKELAEIRKEVAIKKQAETFSNYKKFSRDEENVGDLPNLEELAAKYKLPVVTTELVSAEQLKSHFDNLSILDEKVRVSKQLFGYLYASNIKKADRIQVDVQGAGKAGTSYLHYRIDEVIDAKLKSYEENKEKLVTFTKNELALNLMLEDANKKKAALLEALAASKPFAQEAKALKLNYIDEPKLSSFGKNEKIKLSKQAYEASAQVTPGAISETVNDQDNALFVFVKKREFTKPDGYEQQDKQIIKQASFNLSNLTFSEWITDEFNKAEETDNVSYVGQNK